MRNFVEIEKSFIESVLDVADILAKQDNSFEKLFSELEKYLQLIVVQPCSNASAERSFSALRRLKTYLRNNMTQKRLTNISLMTIHAKRLEKNKSNRTNE